MGAGLIWWRIIIRDKIWRWHGDTVTSSGKLKSLASPLYLHLERSRLLLYIWNLFRDEFCQAQEQYNIINETQHATLRHLKLNSNLWISDSLPDESIQNWMIAGWYHRTFSGYQLDPFRPYDTYMRQWIVSSSVACHLFGDKSSPKPMPNYCQLGLRRHTAVKS